MNNEMDTGEVETFLRLCGGSVSVPKRIFLLTVIAFFCEQLCHVKYDSTSEK